MRELPVVQVPGGWKARRPKQLGGPGGAAGPARFLDKSHGFQRSSQPCHDNPGRTLVGEIEDDFEVPTLALAKSVMAKKSSAQQITAQIAITIKLMKGYVTFRCLGSVKVDE